MMDAKYIAEIKAKVAKAKLDGTWHFSDLDELIAEVERLNAELAYEKNANKTIPTMNGLVKRSVDKIKTLRAENSAKDQQIATLKKALMQAIREGHTDLSPASHQKLFDHYVQAQEQEGK